MSGEAMAQSWEVTCSQRSRPHLVGKCGDCRSAATETCSAPGNGGGPRAGHAVRLAITPVHCALATEFVPVYKQSWQFKWLSEGESSSNFPMIMQRALLRTVSITGSSVEEIKRRRS
jgi:hypothetical protein